MKLTYGAGCVDIEVEAENVGKRYRVSDPGWNETMGDFEVEELAQEPQEAPLGPSTFTIGANALLPVSGQGDLPEPEAWVKAILEALKGQIGDAEAAMRRHANKPYNGGYWKGARDSLISCKRMIERKGKA